jgi:CubicO group peptidase (beta-lactamase class C family)
MQQLVFKPLQLANTGINDDSLDARPATSEGISTGRHLRTEAPPRSTGPPRPGARQVITTAGDQARWVAALFTGKTLSAASRSTILDTAMRVGFG